MKVRAQASIASSLNAALSHPPHFSVLHPLTPSLPPPSLPHPSSTLYNSLVLVRVISDGSMEIGVHLQKPRQAATPCSLHRGLPPVVREGLMNQCQPALHAGIIKFPVLQSKNEFECAQSVHLDVKNFCVIF